MLYRVRRLLSTGHQPGDIVQGTDFLKGVAGILVEKEVRPIMFFKVQVICTPE